MLFIFDMGGVVTSTFGAKNELSTALGISMDDFYSICKKPEPDIWRLLQTGKISVAEFWSTFSKRVGSMQRDLLDGIIDVYDTYKLNKNIDLKNINIPDYDLFRFCFHLELKEGTAELIKGLRKKHRVVCGTNTIDSHWENHMERGDYALFDQTYASNKIGVVKPDTQFWELIMKYEGFKPEETFFVDDREDNCAAAAKLGINVVQFTSEEDLKERWGKYL